MPGAARGLIHGSPNRMLLVIVGILRRLRPPRPAAPGDVMRTHVTAIAHAEEQAPHTPVLVFVHLAGRMHDETARHDRGRLRWRAPRAPARPAEVDLCRLGVAVVRADLARLPAGDGHVPAFDAAENLLDVVLRIPLLLAAKIENVHACSLCFAEA